MAEKSSPEQWQKTEEQVNKAEKAERKRKLADVELRQETGVQKDVREGRAVSAEGETGFSIVEDQEIASELEKEKGMLSQESEQLLGSLNSPERALVKLRQQNLYNALRKKRTLDLEKKDLLDKESSILEEIDQAREQGKPTRGKNIILQKTRTRLDTLADQEKELLTSTPEAYFGLHLKELKEYKDNLKDGKIVETPYVKERADDVATHLRTGKPVMIYGHLGSGKTELATHVSKKYFGKAPYIINGRKDFPASELYGHQSLDVDREANVTISEFHLGPIFKAMEEGRILVIDEFNAIPHEVLISLNHILTRQVGDTVRVQQNSGREIEIQKGYGIILTGNINQGEEKYVAREDIDPAFLSRLYKLEYDYLPQKTDGSLEAEAGPENEAFQLLLARIMDKNGNAEVPKDSIRKLWNLAKAARVIQDVFAGREVNSAFYFQQAGGRAAKYLLKESVLSIRALDNVLSQWQKEGYRYELDYYLYKEFVAQGTIASDKAYLYQQLKDRFGFFSTAGWQQNPNYGTSGNIQSFDIRSPKNQISELEFISPRELVEYAYGKAPERSQWPEINELEELVEEESNNLKELQDLEEFKLASEQDLADIENEIGEMCQISSSPQEAPKATSKPKKKSFLSRLLPS